MTKNEAIKEAKRLKCDLGRFRWFDNVSVEKA
jgi:hypothetical protein